MKDPSMTICNSPNVAEESSPILKQLKSIVIFYAKIHIFVVKTKFCTLKKVNSPFF